MDDRYKIRSIGGISEERRGDGCDAGRAAASRARRTPGSRSPGRFRPIVALRVKAIESLLVDKGLVDRAALDAIVDAFETRIGPRNGARIVARGWVDSAYKAQLLADPRAAIAALGFERYKREQMVVLENPPKLHHLVVCTLCSCYP